MLLSTLKKILGALLVIVGVLALVTPLTPGAWLGLIGLELLGFGFLIPRPIRAWLERLKQKARKIMYRGA